MAIKVTTFVEVHDERLYFPGHLVNRWGNEVRRDIREAVRAAAPVNSRGNKSSHFATFGGPNTPVGWLRANVDATGVANPALRELEFSVQSKAGYTMAVIRGTSGGTKAGDGRFRRNRGGQFAKQDEGFFGGLSDFYALPFNGPGRGAQKVVRFAGQKGNNFFAKGFKVAAARHPAIRSTAIKVF